jgi:hypothetical protein
MKEMERLPRGLRALDLEGRPVELVEIAAERPVLFAFLRHFG